MTVFSRFFAGVSAADRSTLKRQLAAVFVVITLLNLGFYWQRAFRETTIRRNVQSVVRGWDGGAWYVWMIAAPATLLLIRRHPYQPAQPVRSVARLAAGSAAIYFVITNTRYLLRIAPNLWLPSELALPVSWPIYFNTQLERTPLDFLTYCGLFAASFAIDYYWKYRQRAEEVLRLQLQAAQLQSEVAQLQLTALRGQLHPHFLFNSFNALSTLVRQGRNDLAVATIAQLGDLFRSVLDNIELQERPLQDELDFIQCYLDIEVLRFGDKLDTQIEVESAASNALVPNLLLQPLVENAIKHGISRRLAPGKVQIRACRHDTRLCIEIIDDGPSGTFPAAPPPATGVGVGLRNTRSRLDHAYDSDYRFEMLRRPEGGMTVRLDLPWREAVPAVAHGLELTA